MVTLRQAVGLQVDGEIRERQTQCKLLEGAQGPCKVSARTPAISVVSGSCFDSRTGSGKSGFWGRRFRALVLHLYGTVRNLPRE